MEDNYIVVDGKKVIRCANCILPATHRCRVLKSICHDALCFGHWQEHNSKKGKPLPTLEDAKECVLKEYVS